jgi:glycine/D-amino acid oxidase-like deaminating enzyme/nitrite reductase/ring-hydroxylating ferredoxin subunit
VSTTNTTPWLQNERPRFPAIDRNVEVDVVVIGAGITGITAAWLLRRAGKRVALIDRTRALEGDTGHTTAHITCVTDTRLHELAKRFGEDGARVIWEAGATAIDQIGSIAREVNADCNYRRVSGYLHAPVGASDQEQEREEIDRLREDADLAARFDINARFVDRIPHWNVPGVVFHDQATFDPGRYLATLLARIPGEGSFVFEDSALESIEKEPRRVKVAGGYDIRCDSIVIATHNPLAGSLGALRASLFQTKLSLYTSYVLGARVAPGILPDSLFWDTGDPYEYLRIEPRTDHQFVIFGGADSKTGQGDDEAAFTDLQRRLALRVPGVEITHRWLGQVIETDDGLPYIGEHAPGEFVATGYAGNGMTFGTLAGIMARDAVLGWSNPWADLLRVDRKPFHGGLWRYLRENLDYPWYLLRDRLGRADVHAVESVPAGEGRIVSLRAGKCAVHRAENGSLSICSAVCTHMKCIVHWNGADRTWDCPCHGSRFSPQGEVLGGPAEQPLERLDPRSTS